MKNKLIFFATIIVSVFGSYGQKKDYSYKASETALSFSADAGMKYITREDVCAVYIAAKGKDSSKTELSPMRLSFSVIKKDDAGEEQLLNKEPDGALQFALVVMEGAKKSGEGQVTVNGSAVKYYKVSGKAPSVEGKPYTTRVCMVLVLHNKNDNIFVVADCSQAFAAKGEKYFTEILQTLKF